MSIIYLSVFLTVLLFYPTKAATSYPASGLSSHMAQWEQQHGIYILLRSTAPLRRNNNNQPESATPYYSIWKEQQQLIQMLLRTVP